MRNTDHVVSDLHLFGGAFGAQTEYRQRGADLTGIAPVGAPPSPQRPTTPVRRCNSWLLLSARASCLATPQ